MRTTTGARRKVAAVAAAALLTLLAACGSDPEPEPEPAPPEPTATTTPEVATEQAALPDTVTIDVDINVDDAGDHVRTANNRCYAETPDGDPLGLRYTATGAVLTEVELPVHDVSMRDGSCQFRLEVHGPRVVNPGSARIIIMDGADTPVVSDTPTVARDGVDVHFTFSMTPPQTPPAPKPEATEAPDPEQSAEDALIAALEDAGEDSSEWYVQDAHETCDAIASWGDDERVWRMADERMNRTSDQLAVEHLCPQFTDDMDLAERAIFYRVSPVRAGADLEEGEVEPGTYRTGPDVRDCYWERATGSGDIIDNGFVTAATDGIQVTLYDGETFIKESNCGAWIPVD